RTCWRTAPTCAPSRSCSATARSPRPRSTRIWRSRGCSPSIAALIRGRGGSRAERNERAAVLLHSRRRGPPGTDAAAAAAGGAGPGAGGRGGSFLAEPADPPRRSLVARPLRAPRRRGAVDGVADERRSRPPRAGARGRPADDPDAPAAGALRSRRRRRAASHRRGDRPPGAPGDERRRHGGDRRLRIPPSGGIRPLCLGSRQRRAGGPRGDAAGRHAGRSGRVPPGPFIPLIYNPRPMDTFASTTVLLVRRDGRVCMASDGQVTMNQNTIVKSGAKKIRRAGKGQVLVGFAGGGADTLALFARLEAKLEEFGGNLERAVVELA